MMKPAVSLSVPALAASVFTLGQVQAAPYGWRPAAPGYYYADK